MSLSAAYDQAVTVNYATADGTVVPLISGSTGVAGVNYQATAGTLTFAPGETIKTITVEAFAVPPGGEWNFSVNLSGASSNAQIIDGVGIGTIYFGWTDTGGSSIYLPSTEPDPNPYGDGY